MVSSALPFSFSSEQSHQIFRFISFLERQRTLECHFWWLHSCLAWGSVHIWFAYRIRASISRHSSLLLWGLWANSHRSFYWSSANWWRGRQSAGDDRPQQRHRCVAGRSWHSLWQVNSFPSLVLLFLSLLILFVCCLHCLSGPHLLTRQGKLDNRWPFLSISIPNQVLNRFPLLADNLETNRDRLITPFDLGATLRHFLSYPSSPPNSSLSFFGKSLLLPISHSRSCEEAGIPFHFCACVRWVPANSSAFFYRRVERASRQLFRTCVEIPLSRHLSSIGCQPPDSVSVDSMSFARPSFADPDGFDETLVRSRTIVSIGRRNITWDLVFALESDQEELDDPTAYECSHCQYWRNRYLWLIDPFRVNNLTPDELIPEDSPDFKLFSSPIYCMKELHWFSSVRHSSFFSSSEISFAACELRHPPVFPSDCLLFSCTLSFVLL